MTKFKQGDEVSFVSKKSGNAVICIVDFVSPSTGEVQLYKKDNPTSDPTKMVFKNPSELTLIQASAEVVVQPKQVKPKTFKWMCLECGTKHNSYKCPTCDSDEKIHNTDADTDPSILLGGSYSESYYPGE